MGAPTDERWTPESVLHVVRKLGPIGLDPCTTAANPTKADAWITVENDGLSMPWHASRGLIWINPPYSRGELLRWATKAVHEWLEWGSEMVMLTPCDLGTQWASVLFKHAAMLAGWRGRIAFVRPDGSYETGAKQPSVFWYLGSRLGVFAEVFKAFANVTKLGGV